MQTSNKTQSQIITCMRPLLFLIISLLAALSAQQEIFFDSDSNSIKNCGCGPRRCSQLRRAAVIFAMPDSNIKRSAAFLPLCG
ncbi:hypothetical protein EV702DRAFT_628104 [Suillus placidus]|uniref:Uncharacterized protein n=1 Tax=Suillus placidus TaxID=48579 RepID=A0A9P6ZM53_9AGAM|nr:hypothetical protein EV702DRAFT_628104 [Suillus placidus]